MPGIEDFRYETWELDALVESIEPLAPFLYSRYFTSRTVQSTVPNIEWDIIEGGQRLAPFVSPFVPGVHIRSRGHATYSFTPAYVKPAKTLQPSQGFVRLPGEKYGGELSPRQRLDRLLAQQIQLHDDMLTNRQNWMAAKILTDGEVTISGDNYQSVTVNFGQHADLRPAALSAGARWSQTTGVPLDDIEAAALDVRQLSYGATVGDVVMDGKAWGYFRTRMADNKLFDQTLSLNDGGRTSIDGGPRNDTNGTRVGRVAGRFEVFVYDGQYEDEEGVMTNFMTDYSCLLISSGLQGTTYYGAIQDLNAEMQALRMFHKSRTKWEPSGIELVSQSAPIIAPRRRNAHARLIVHQ